MIKLVPIAGNGVAIEVYGIRPIKSKPHFRYIHQYTIEFLEADGRLTVTSRNTKGEIIDTDAATYEYQSKPVQKISASMMHIGAKKDA